MSNESLVLAIETLRTLVSEQPGESLERLTREVSIEFDVPAWLLRLASQS